MKQLDLFKDTPVKTVFDWAKDIIGIRPVTEEEVFREIHEPLPGRISDSPWPPQPMIINTGSITHHKCAFDGLPPGVYGLTCSCPRCSPQCGYTSVSSGNASVVLS